MRASLDLGAPLRQSEDVVIEALDDELLVYDRTNNRAHLLSATAARVWRACNGSTELTAMSAALGLPLAVVREALDALDASRLLDHGLELVTGGSDDDNAKAITRRELAARSARVATAAGTAPLILSIAAPTALAAATPTPFQCQVYTTQDCGTSSGCGAIAGCCCCCQGSSGSCKVCSSTSFCNSGQQTCPTELGGGTSHCSSVGSGGTPSAQGCCGVSGAKNCGCAYTPAGVTLLASPGAPSGGAGCCDPTNGGAACTPALSANCVPCCNGTPIGPSSPFDCCVPGPTTTCPVT